MICCIEQFRVFTDVDDDCAFAPCSLLGTAKCRDLVKNYTCVCVPGFTGRLCETGLNLNNVTL